MAPKITRIDAGVLHLQAQLGMCPQGQKEIMQGLLRVTNLNDFCFPIQR